MTIKPLDLLSYPRAVLATVFNIVLTFSLCFVVLFLALVVRNRDWVDWVLINLWSKPLLLPGGVHVEVRGADLVKNSPKGFLILFNHSSLVDIPVLYGYFPRMFRFGAKVELFKIPFFGRAMKSVGVLPIDRGNRNKVMKVYEEAIARIDNGECFALAPEGTRQDNVQLGKFKRGPFEFAINAKMDVVPVIIGGALQVLPKHSIWMNMGRWRRKIILQITPPIAASEYTMETVMDLQERVRAQMQPAFDQVNADLAAPSNGF